MSMNVMVHCVHMNNVVHQSETDTQKVAISENKDCLRISQKSHYQKLTIDFGNHTKRPAETKACIVLDVDN